MGEIKRAISEGHAVHAYVDSSELANPFHATKDNIFIRIVGYTDTHFTTFDTGFRTEQKFNYLISDFMKALEASGGDVFYFRD